MRILIDNSIIIMNSENLTYLREEYPSVLTYFIQKNINDYVEIMTDELFVFSELLLILDWDISDILKLKLLKFASEPISVIDTNYSMEVCKYILRNNLMRRDLESLYLSYDHHPDEIKVIIEGYAVNSIDEIIASPDMVTLLLKEKLLESLEMVIENKINLIVAMIPDIDLKNACRYLSSIGFNEYEKILDSHSRPKFPVDDYNTMLLEAFKKRMWIFEYFEDELHPEYYKIRRKESKKSYILPK